MQHAPAVHTIGFEGQFLRNVAESVSIEIEALLHTCDAQQTRTPLKCATPLSMADNDRHPEGQSRV